MSPVPIVIRFPLQLGWRLRETRAFTSRISNYPDHPCTFAYIGGGLEGIYSTPRTPHDHRRRAFPRAAPRTSLPAPPRPNVQPPRAAGRRGGRGPPSPASAFVFESCNATSGTGRTKMDMLSFIIAMASNLLAMASNLQKKSGPMMRCFSSWRSSWTAVESWLELCWSCSPVFFVNTRTMACQEDICFAHCNPSEC